MQPANRCGRPSSTGRLHRVTSIIAGLPLLEEARVIKRQTRGVLSEIDVECRSGESGGQSKRQLTKKHQRTAPTAAVILAGQYTGINREASGQLGQLLPTARRRPDLIAKVKK